MTVSGPAWQALRVLWNLRVLSLFLIGPALGVALGGAIFGLPTNVLWAAAAMFLVSLSLLGVLVRAEWRRLSRDGGRGP